MKTSKLIELLSNMPQSAEVYFETWVEESPGVNRQIVKKADVVHCIINGDENGVVKEITIMSHSDMFNLEDGDES